MSTVFPNPGDISAEQLLLETGFQQKIITNFSYQPQEKFIKFLDPGIDWRQKLLCITHSDRPTEDGRANLNFLETRFQKPNRLPPKCDFNTLTPISEHQTYHGSVTIWYFSEGDYSKPRLLLFLRPDYKPQHAIWYQEKLWILGVDRLEVYDSSLSRLALIEDTWLSGAHTIFPDGRGNLLVTCSASDSVLLIDEQSFAVASVLRLPESIYGHNFELSRTDSVVEHYITNDLQLTHINAASSWRNGIVVSTFIQGAIGWFNSQGKYKELLRGFVGCHGVRADTRTEQLYFCDTCLGTVIFLDNNLNIERRIATGSTWLHDAQQIEGDVFAVAAMDRNQVEIMDIQSRQVILTIPGHEFGLGTQFLYYGQ